MKRFLKETWLYIGIGVVLGVAYMALVVPAFGVTPEDIAAQLAVVQAEQSKLDSLQSLALANQRQASLVDVDSTLAANRIQILVDAKPFDPQYVCIAVPYSTWSAQIQQLWTLGLTLAPQHIPVSTGRYAVRQDHLAGFLAATKSFLTSL